MASSNKKGGPDLAKLVGGEAAQGPASARQPNLFARHGNQQITDVIQQAKTAQPAESQFLQQLGPQQDEAQQSSWWQDEEATRKGAGRDEEEAQVARKPDAEEDKAAAKKDHQRGRKLSVQEEHEELKSKRAQMSAGELQDKEKALLKDAERQGLTEDAKAAMLVKSGNLDADVVAAQTGGVQALIAADRMPSNLADLNRDAAPLLAERPLDDRQAMRNVTDELRLLAKQMHNYPTLMSPGLSIEGRATQLVDVLASQLDVATRESVAAHPYVGLVEDLIFDPQAILEINTIAGGNRDVRALGGFSVVLWQLAVDTVREQLNVQDAGDQVDETKLWSDQMAFLARKMYADALLKPSVS